MENKQLNFHQPLLSVRRSLPTNPSVQDDKTKAHHHHFQSKVATIPCYRSELKSGPVTNAGSVPFVWENTPGKPKKESTPPNHVTERPPVAPKLPPGRILKATFQESDTNAEQLSLSKRHGEQVPYCAQNFSTSTQNVGKLESSSTDAMDEESCDSEDGNETYLDALDTLSRCESVSLNCSVSGLDGSGLSTPGAFSPDVQTRDFMMGRFLPAAKAMTSETPQYITRKHPVVWEQPRQIMNGDKRPSLRYESNVGPLYSQEKYLEESDDEYDEQRRFPAKVCGLIPRFCLKSSLCLLNPVPGMSVRTPASMSPGCRTHGSSSSAGSSCEIENEPIRTTVNEQRPLNDNLEATELHDNRIDSNYKSDQLSCPFNPHKLEGSNLYKRLQGNELPKSAVSEQKGFLNIPGEATCKSNRATGFSPLRKGSSTFKELLAVNRDVDVGSPVIEKTLHIDILHKVESLGINSNDSSDIKGRNVVITFSKRKPVKEIPSIDSVDEDANILDVKGEEANLKDHVDLNQVLAVNTLKGFGQKECLTGKLHTSIKSKVSHKVDMDSETQQPPKPKAEELDASNGNCLKLPVPPPLPKSPSDSWLWRTSPSIPSRSQSSRSHFGTRIHPGNHATKTSGHPKWRTSVKTTMGQQQDVQSHAELLTPIPETTQMACHEFL